MIVINKLSQKNVGVGKEMEKAAAASEEKHGPPRASADSGQKSRFVEIIESHGDQMSICSHSPR
jgi:hypothetical protein